MIEIEFPSDYPDNLPVVREVGGRIPRNADHHINNSSGDICLLVPDECWRVFPYGASFLDFLNVPVFNYFLGESLVELGHPRPFGERSHGIAGVFEYYAEALGTQDRHVIANFVECLSRAPAKGHWLCPCGSGLRIRRCHQDLIRSLEDRIPARVAKGTLAHIRGQKRN